LRNADVYLRSGQLAQRNAGAAAEGTLLVVPQFLAGIDIPAHGLPPETLRWGLISWQGGEDAEGPAPISSFDALDAIVARLADARLFPALRAIVVAGHSGGGQVAQRYATIGQAETALGASRGRVALRYVVANPSSYAWPGPERPDGQVGFALPAGCPGYDAWKYGYAGLPRYAGGVAAAGLEEAYLARDVVYLVGQADVDPMHSALDRTCPAALQGPHRLGRGRAFFAYLLARHPDGVAHRLLEVPGVGHDSAGMFGSACGRSALFDAPGC
jgi:pimeloyl-ACP methyl ester carboxylesterase